MIPTSDRVYALLYGVRHQTLREGDLRVREEPELQSIFATHLPDDKKLDPINKLDAVGEERVIQVKAIIDDLKAEGVDRHLPVGVDKEAALVAFATCYHYKQELAKQVANMNPKEREKMLTDLKKWPELFKSLDMDSSHDYGLMARVKDEDKPVLSRYFDGGGRKIHMAISAVQQLEKLEKNSGMPSINDPGLDKYLAPWLNTEMYVPEIKEKNNRFTHKKN
ncbi:hypothetical protein HY310_00320 [Candidatus Microgenomates bacterium]|nr:hypothetical protein [Candidatus Microgenomates bacterium]